MWSPRGRGGRGFRGNRGSNRRGNSFRGSRGRPGGSPRDFNRKYSENSQNDDKTNRKPVAKNNYDYGLVEKLNEVDLGITEFISSKLEGFTGILKSRFSDFQVNEINLEGVVAKLTDINPPTEPEPVKEEEDDDGLVNRYRIEQLPIETWDRIHKMVQTKDKNEFIEIDVTHLTKDDRTQIHEAVKIVFGQKVVGSTITKDDKKFVTFKLYNKHDRIDNREKWPKSRGGDYVYFLVYKESTDTIEANIQISESLRMRPSHFCYAGVKDRRAKTTQWFCARKVEPSKILERTKYLRNIHIGNFSYKTEPLKLGQLKGNRFRIALRNITADDNVINKALESLRDNGFINYYGLQRFGNCKEIPTHEIGIELLKGNWKQACHLILKPRKYEQDRDISAAKLIYESSGDAARAFGTLEKKRNRCIEGKLLGGLMKSPENYVNALENVPRNMRLLYIHAYQSWVWNRMVSRRISEFGLTPIVGDLVVEGELQPTDEVLTEDAVVAADDAVLDNAEEDLQIDIDVKEQVRPQVKVKVLTEEDLPNFTIYDIVLPLPGYDINYPNNVVKDWYSELLTKDGLSLEMPKQRVRTYTLSGAYRKIIERVTNLSWKTMKYNDPVYNLIQSDYEELTGKPEPENIPDGQYKALIIDFCLSSSCYATMALREIMKMDTSVETHMNFNKKMKKDHADSSSQNISESIQTEIKEKESGEKEMKEVEIQTDISLTTDCDSTDIKLIIKKEIQKIKETNPDKEENIQEIINDTADKRKNNEADDGESDSKKLKVEDFI